MSDLMLYSRIESAATSAGTDLVRADTPAGVPLDAELVLVDWSAREGSWAAALKGLAGRVILFGPHTDLEAHTAAREAGLGPMWARSKLVAKLPSLLSG